jgi:GcrA cell cycle regulator
MEGSVSLRRRRRAFAGSPWTQERIEYAVGRWSEGASARQISRELGREISRSAVLGLICRLGIGDLSPFGGTRVKHSDKKADGTKGIGARTSSPAYCPLGTSRRPPPGWVANAEPQVDDPGIDGDIPHERRRSLLELTDDTCRWPVGAPGAPDFFFCGAQPLPDRPYCAAHWARAERTDEAEPVLAPDLDTDLDPDLDPDLDDVSDFNETEWEDA